MKVSAWLILTAAAALAAGPLPIKDLPPGKVMMVIQPHHDDHTTDYGMGGLIAKFTDAGYESHFVRASNDEKDGAHGYGHNDLINERESKAAIAILGMSELYSLSWRNDYMDPIPLQELRAQLIFLIRKHRPDVVLTHDPWGHYDRNPDHRKVARAMGDAYWLAGLENVHPEHFELGVRPHRVPYLFYKARVDYGKGHEPNVAVELNESQVRRKMRAYATHRNVYASPAMARSVREQLAQEGLELPDLRGLTNEAAAVEMEEWHMDWISRKRGRENGVRYAEVYYFVDEFDHLPGLKEYLRQHTVQK